ncbi:MAG: hypothetical protein ACYDBV_11210 [Nitrospiria bacterium]
MKKKMSYMSPTQAKTKHDENDFFNRVKQAKNPDWKRNEGEAATPEDPPKQKSKRQVRFLLSSGSPLSDKQKDKLKKELHSGSVTEK